MNIQRIFNEQEKEDRDRLEATIKKGKKAFVDVGRALAEIRDRKLWRDVFDSFDAYCQEKWGFKRRRADELIQGAAVAGALAEVSGIPLNAGQATALSSVPEPDREKVLEAASEKAKSEDRPMTAADIKAQWDAANPPDDEESPRGAPPAEEQGQEAFFGDEPATDEPEPPVDPQLETSPALAAFQNPVNILAEEFAPESTHMDRRLACNFLNQLIHKFIKMN